MPNQINKGFAEFIRKRRETIRKSSKDVAHEIGLSAAQYCRIEKGLRPLNDNTQLPKLAKSLNLTEEELMRGFDSPTTGINIRSLVCALAEAKQDPIYMEDITWLIEIQKELNKPMSPDLIDGLFAHKKKN